MASIIGNVQGIGEVVGGVGKTILDIGRGIRTLITGKLDPETQNKFDLEWAQLEQTVISQQNAINEAEARSSSWFIAGARPAIIWICALVLFYTYIISPILKACGVMLPEMGLAELWPIMTGLLGLGGLRTYEKIKGVQGKH